MENLYDFLNINSSSSIIENVKETDTDLSRSLERLEVCIKKSQLEFFDCVYVLI